MKKTIGMLVLLVLIASCNHGEGNKPNNPVPPPDVAKIDYPFADVPVGGQSNQRSQMDW